MLSKTLKKKLSQGYRKLADEKKQIHGFTLMELIVVLSLLSIMLVFSVPRIHDTLFLDDTKKSSRWIINKIQTLKEASLQNQKEYILHIDLDSGRFWETDETMSTEAMEAAYLNANALPNNLKIVDIQYPQRGKISSGRADIRFYKSGYTDKALIHIQDDDNYISYLIEPFLQEVQFYETYADFEQ